MAADELLDWSRREAQLLDAITHFEAKGELPEFEQLVEHTKLTRRAAEFGLQALIDAGYVDGIDARTMSGFNYLSLRLLPAGRQVLGHWPSHGVNGVTSGGRYQMELFISHSSGDAKVAEALIEFLRSALDIPASQVRCTSVDGYRLPGGADTKQQLRQEVSDAESFIALVSPDSLKSSFMMFELGARWGAVKHLIPLTIRGMRAGSLPSPLNDLNALDAANEAQLHQLVRDLGKVIGREPTGPAVYQRSLDRFKKTQEDFLSDIL